MGYTIVDTPRGIDAYRKLAIRAALSLEIKGLKHSRFNAHSYVKKTYGFKGNRQKILEQYEALLRKEGILVDKPESTQ